MAAVQLLQQALENTERILYERDELLRQTSASLGQAHECIAVHTETISELKAVITALENRLASEAASAVQLQHDLQLKQSLYATLEPQLKPGAILVNTSRGGVVDQAALTNAVRTRGLRAGLDVWANEPDGVEGTFADALVHEPHVIGTHHVGALTEQAQRAVADEVQKPTAKVRELLEEVNEGIAAFGLEALLPGFYAGGLAAG